MADKLTSNELATTSNGKNAEIVSGLDRSVKLKPLGEQPRAVRRQGLMVILGNIGVLTSGMGLGLPTVTLAQLTDDREAIHLTQSQASWFASINALSCPLGGLLSGYLLDKFGRKSTLYVLNVIGLVAWALMALAIQDDPDVVYMQLLVSRFMIGIATGLSSAPVGVYSAEICLPRIRGCMILGTSISIASGITLIYVLGYFIRNDWHLIALICCGYQIFALLCVIPMPESPNWLVSKGHFVSAKKSLNYFRGLDKSAVIDNPEVAAEYSSLQRSVKVEIGEKKMSFIRSLKLPEVYKPLSILMALFCFQQLTGIFVVIVYAVQISTEAGVSIDPLLCAVLVGLTRVLTTCPMGVILEKWGRRRAGLISSGGMCACMSLLAAQGWSQWLRGVPYLPVIAILSFIAFSTLGLYTLPFFMLSELFPQNVRGPASGLTVAVGMFIAFVMLKTYPAMKEIGNESCFLVYAIMAFVAMVFVYLVLPETRGRTLLEIEEHFRNGSQSLAEVEMQEVFIKTIPS